MSRPNNLASAPSLCLPPPSSSCLRELLLFSIFQALYTPDFKTFIISSQKKSASTWPEDYMNIEDVIVIDTSVGGANKKALNERYETSSLVRNMLC